MKFLLVDDNEITLQLQRLVLEDCGLNITTATNGKTAIELALKNEYAMIFTDIQMPDMDGFAVAEQIRKFNSTVPIIALSADEISANDERFAKAGMNGSLCKPLGPDKVSDLLKSFSFSKGKADTDNNQNNCDILFGYDDLLSLMGDKQFIAELLEQFLSLHGNDCDMLKQYIDNKDYLSARGVLHTLTGVAGNMYCTRLYKSALLLGSELRQERSDSFDDFTETWHLTINKLSGYCKSLSENI